VNVQIHACSPSRLIPVSPTWTTSAYWIWWRICSYSQRPARVARSVACRAAAPDNSSPWSCSKRSPIFR